jgi:methylase of polypeptide subunit release factors
MPSPDAATPPAPLAGDPVIEWTEFDAPVQARWRSESGLPPPKRVRVADEKISLDEGYKAICEGTALLWRGDYHRAKDFLQAIAKRIDSRGRGDAGSRRGHDARAPGTEDMAAAFHRQRQLQGARTRLLGMLLLPFEPDHALALRRAPDVQAACTEAFGPSDVPSVMPLRDLLGAIGAHEWRKAGVEVSALRAKVHAHYGVFSPVRGEYLELVYKAPFPPALHHGADAENPQAQAFDVGTGTGVLAALLARRGVPRVVATDNSPRALACARDNLERLELAARVEVESADLFPDARHGLAALVVCNPPWLPGRANTPLEHAVYDPDSRMLRGFLAGLAARLAPAGEGWLVLSDLAERLGLRSRQQLQTWIADAGLVVLGRIDTRPRHARASDATDPLHAARSAEVTSLWRLGRAEDATA